MPPGSVEELARLLRCPYCGHPVNVCVSAALEGGFTMWVECGNCCAEWDHAGAPTGLPQIKTIRQGLERAVPELGSVE